MPSDQVEDSLKEEPETFLSLVGGFVVSFEQADRFNQETLRLEAQKRQREEAASAKRESAAHRAKAVPICGVPSWAW